MDLNILTWSSSSATLNASVISNFSSKDLNVTAFSNAGINALSTTNLLGGFVNRIFPEQGNHIRGWGDPHHVDGDRNAALTRGENVDDISYDVQLYAGAVANQVSNTTLDGKLVQLNSRYDSFQGQDDLTVFGQHGLTIGGDQVEISKDGTVKVNSVLVDKGDSITTSEGLIVDYSNGTLDVKTPANKSGDHEYHFNFQFVDHEGGDHVNYDLWVHGAKDSFDGISGVGLDADTEMMSGDKGKGANGGESIFGPGRAAQDYVIDDGNIFDTSFAGDLKAREEAEDLVVLNTMISGSDFVRDILNFDWGSESS